MRYASTRRWHVQPLDDTVHSIVVSVHLVPHLVGIRELLRCHRHRRLRRDVARQPRIRQWPARTRRQRRRRRRRGLHDRPRRRDMRRGNHPHHCQAPRHTPRRGSRSSRDATYASAPPHHLHRAAEFPPTPSLPDESTAIVALAARRLQRSPALRRIIVPGDNSRRATRPKSRRVIAVDSARELYRPLIPN